MTPQPRVRLNGFFPFNNYARTRPRRLARIGGARRVGIGAQAGLPVLLEVSRKLVALEFGDAVGYIAVVNIHGVDLAEAVERLLRFAGIFEGHAQIVAQRENRILLEAGRFERADTTSTRPWERISMKQRPSMVEQFIA